jgi:hypothetical protein
MNPFHKKIVSFPGLQLEFKAVERVESKPQSRTKKIHSYNVFFFFLFSSKHTHIIVLTLMLIDLVSNLILFVYS